MRTPVQRIHLGLTCRVAVLALLAGIGSGCSSGFTRFDSSLYSSAAQPPQSSQEYPGVDPASTGSIPGAPVPSGDLTSGGAVSGAAYSQGSSYATPAYAPAASNSSSAIQRTTLASPIANAPAYDKPPLLAPSTKSGGIDPVRTSSVKPAPVNDSVSEPVAAKPVAPAVAATPKITAPAVTATAKAAAPAVAATAKAAAPAAVAATAKAAAPAAVAATGNERGWTATGGTTITMREGETLYNLSKRYGVPVNAILSANGIKDANAVQSGQNVVIPTYVYSRNAPISAPDNDPAQQSASSGRGQMAMQTAAVVPVEDQTVKDDPRYEPKRRAQPPASDNNAPDYSVTTGSVAGATAVTVVAGDSLNRIASKAGVSVAALKAANGLTTDNLKIGQVLSLPKPGQPATATTTAAVKPAATDATVTGTTSPASSDAPKPYVKPSSGGTQTASTEPAAPARTGIDEFRWPVRGRVISNFGEKSATGRNDGIDISVPEGTAVKATENGVVVYAGNELEGLGNLVLVRHADGWVSAYAHNKEIDVKRGEEVRRGQTIARSGRTGATDMPKLHFELRKNSTPVDPLKHLGGA
jgi:murein DD-endopeptidase MepM/ murein hydrolase activator NlpD